MYATYRSLYDRSLEKTPEQLFVNSLRKEFELSPAESEAILSVAKQTLFGAAPEGVGQVHFLCASRTAKHGRPLGDQDKVQVTLSLDRGIEDLDVLRTQGRIALRQVRMLRVTDEAYEQDGLLTQEDLSRLLQVSVRTIRADIQALLADGNTVHTRGFDHDIGRGVSHKTQIVDLYLCGYTYDEIMRKSRHSAHSIKRYVLTFGRLLLLKSRQVDQVEELSRLLGLSDRLTREYLELFDRHMRGDEWPPAYVELLQQLQTVYPSKKKETRWGAGGDDER